MPQGKSKSGHKQNNAAKRKRAIYLLQGRKEKNRLRRLKKQLKYHPNDATNPLHPGCDRVYLPKAM